MTAECKHKWVHRGSDSYWCFDGRNSRRYYYVDYYFCEKCLAENKVEKIHSCYDGEIYKLPEWARLITKKVAGYE